MNTRHLMAGALTALGIMMSAVTARADTFSFDTSSLSGGPFYVNFQFLDGSGTGDANNTVTISSFSGGVPVGTPTLTGGASGNLSGTVTLTDSGFFNEFIQQFTPGGTLGFDLAFTNNVDAGGTPDGFTFAILDGAFREVPTTDPLGTNVLLRLDINSSNPVVQTFALTAAPPPTSVPEPTTLLLLSTGLAGIAAGVHAKRKASKGEEA